MKHRFYHDISKSNFGCSVFPNFGFLVVKVWVLLLKSIPYQIPNWMPYQIPYKIQAQSGGFARQARSRAKPPGWVFLIIKTCCCTMQVSNNTFFNEKDPTKQKAPARNTAGTNSEVGSKKGSDLTFKQLWVEPLTQLSLQILSFIHLMIFCPNPKNSKSYWNPVHILDFPL